MIALAPTPTLQTARLTLRAGTAPREGGCLRQEPGESGSDDGRAPMASAEGKRHAPGTAMDGAPLHVSRHSGVPA